LLAEPKLEVPNQERNIADLNFSAVRATDVPLLPKPPSSTTPIRIVSSTPSGPVPQSAALDSGAHEPANVISIPDMPLPRAKVLIIPAINQVATAQMAGGGDRGFGSEASGGNAGGGQAAQGGGGKGAGQGTASGAGAGTSLSGASPGGGGGGAGVAGPGGRGAGQGAMAGSGAGAGTGAGNGAGAGTGKGLGAGDGTGTGSTHVARIVRPQDGHFAAVVLGSSATQAYPEAVGALEGRLVYTVYLRVGTKKSWIMQYCLPRSVEQAVKVKGTATPVDPPFPFLILRPDLEFAQEMDYVIVHGMVNSSGKFEQLSIVGMTGFAQERLLLSSLELWQFRPAARDGKATTVEVLLIIPREEV